MFNPPLLGKTTGGLLGAINVGNAGGGTNWPGAGCDPETHIVYAQAANWRSSAACRCDEPPPGFSDMQIRVRRREAADSARRSGPGFGSAADSPLAAARGRAGARRRRGGAGAAGADAARRRRPPARARRRRAGGGGGLAGRRAAASSSRRTACSSAIDLDKGELKWQVPHGDTPDNVRNNPALQGMNIPKTGQNGSVGLMVTKTLVVLGDPQVTTTPGHPRGAMLRAYDKNNGKEVGAVWMPAPQSGSPMTYMADGKQYIVVAVSGGNYSGEYIAFALPNAPRSTQRRAAVSTSTQSKKGIQK